MKAKVQHDVKESEQYLAAPVYLIWRQRGVMLAYWYYSCCQQSDYYKGLNTIGEHKNSRVSYTVANYAWDVHEKKGNGNTQRGYPKDLVLFLRRVIIEDDIGLKGDEEEQN